VRVDFDRVSKHKQGEREREGRKTRKRSVPHGSQNGLIRSASLVHTHTHNHIFSPCVSPHGLSKVGWWWWWHMQPPLLLFPSITLPRSWVVDGDGHLVGPFEEQHDEQGRLSSTTPDRPLPAPTATWCSLSAPCVLACTPASPLAFYRYHY
jgi:hypothetical protein